MPVYTGWLLAIVKDRAKEGDPHQLAYGLPTKSNTIPPTSTRDLTLKYLQKIVVHIFKRTPGENPPLVDMYYIAQLAHPKKY